MGKIFFSKMHGAGNDFVLIDDVKNPNLTIDSELIKSLCDRRFGIGADGVLQIKYSDASGFDLSYFNSDGSGGMLCGNGARCGIYYYSKVMEIGKFSEIKFSSFNMDYSGKIIDENIIQFNMQNTKSPKKDILEIDGQEIPFYFVNTGARHVIINYDELGINEEFPLWKMNDYAKKIRSHEFFGDEGTNVNFFKIEKDFIAIRTFEKGVEDETLACGTGSAAVGIVSNIHYNISAPIRIKTIKGIYLIIKFAVNNNEINDLSLTGPSHLVFNGEYYFK